MNQVQFHASVTRSYFLATDKQTDRLRGKLHRITVNILTCSNIVLRNNRFRSNEVRFFRERSKT